MCAASKPLARDAEARAVPEARITLVSSRASSACFLNANGARLGAGEDDCDASENRIRKFRNR